MQDRRLLARHPLPVFGDALFEGKPAAARAAENRANQAQTIGPLGGDSGRCAGLLERPAIARTGRALVVTGACRRQVLRAEHGELERAWLRTQLVTPGDSTVE